MTATRVRPYRRRARKLSFNEGLARQLEAWAKEKEREAAAAREAAEALRR